MNVEIFALCDAATDYQGKLNILGTFDGIWAKSVPAVHPQCSVAIRLRFSRSEQGEHRVSLHLINADGKPILPPLNATIQVNLRDDDVSMATNLVLNIHGLKLEAYGECSLNLMIDERLATSLPLFVKRAP